MSGILGLRNKVLQVFLAFFGYFHVSLDSPYWTKDGLLTVCVPGQGRNPEGTNLGTAFEGSWFLAAKEGIGAKKIADHPSLCFTSQESECNSPTLLEETRARRKVVLVERSLNEAFFRDSKGGPERN